MNPGRYPLFPLNTVLFPDCKLPLQIFEQRYLRLVKECMRDDEGFVVVLISEGNEVGGAPSIYSTGTWVKITDWKQLDNGLLGITITAQDRVRVDRPSAQDDGLLTAEVYPLSSRTDAPELLDQYQDLIGTLKQLEEHPWTRQFDLTIDYASSDDVCNKLSYLLPIPGVDKQSLLETDNSSDLLMMLRNIITNLQD